MNKTLVTTTAVAIFIFAQIGFVTLTAQANPMISVDPAYLKASHGDTFTVNITVDPANEKIRGAAFELYFNNSLLNATSLAQGTFFSGFDTWFRGETDNITGKIDYGEAITGDEGKGVTESGKLATITFQAIGEHGVSKLRFEEILLSDPWASEISNVTINNGTVEIEAPFLIYGYVSYEDGSECNDPKVNIINMNTKEEWQAKTNESSNYYQLMLSSGTDINASEVLRFNVTSPDGSQSNITEHTVTMEEINDGGLFGFNISLSAPASGLCGDVAPYPDCSGKVDMGDVILLLNNVSYPENPRYVLCNGWAGDCRCSGKIDMGDVILLLNNVSYPENPRYVLDCCD